MGIRRVARNCVRKEREMKLLIFLSAVIMAVTSLLFATGIVKIEVM